MVAMRDRQKEIEKRLMKPLALELTPGVTFREAFGEFERWILKIGQFSLFLNPINRCWLFYDSIHDIWVDTGFFAGEVEFFLNGEALDVKPLKKDENVSSYQSGYRLTPLGEESGQRSYYVLPMTLIGRDKNCDIRFTDDLISGMQALIIQHRGGFSIFDIGSESKTLLNGEPVPKGGTLLKDSDKITVGQTELLFGSIESEEASIQKSSSQSAEAKQGDFICPGCSNILRQQANFCPRCGTRIVKEPRRVCDSCGKMLEEDMNFCPGCGAPAKK